MIHDFYDMIDNDGSGEIDAEEFLEAMKKFGKVFFCFLQLSFSFQG